MQSTSISNDIIDNATNKEICEALGCSQQAIKEITVNAGKFGTISLSLCGNCVGKFVNSKARGDSVHAN
jgi:hypothetical protein